jgi:hypothetical protein
VLQASATSTAFAGRADVTGSGYALETYAYQFPAPGGDNASGSLSLVLSGDRKTVSQAYTLVDRTTAVQFVGVLLAYCATLVTAVKLAMVGVEGLCLHCRVPHAFYAPWMRGPGEGRTQAAGRGGEGSGGDDDGTGGGACCCGSSEGDRGWNGADQLGGSTSAGRGGLDAEGRGHGDVELEPRLKDRDPAPASAPSVSRDAYGKVRGSRTSAPPHAHANAHAHAHAHAHAAHSSPAVSSSSSSESTAAAAAACEDAEVVVLVNSPFETGPDTLQPLTKRTPPARLSMRSNGPAAPPLPPPPA